MTRVAPKGKALQVRRVEKYLSLFGDWQKQDTVVFVHGITGDHLSTWGEFPRLIKTDSELPNLNVMSWGYRTSLFSPFVSNTTTLGKNLSAKMNTQIAPGVQSYLVGHSMGGLVIFESLVGQFERGRAQEHPNVGVSQITLFASPVSGSNAARIAKDLLGKLWLIGYVINPQVRSLARGERTEKLLDAVYKRIYAPRNDGKKARTIPIRTIVASHDGAVNPEDKDAFKAKFNKDTPLELEYGHSDVKMPNSHLDSRYRALANDLKTRLAVTFNELCLRWLNGSASDRLDADIEFDLLYGVMVRDQFIQGGGDPTKQINIYRDYLTLIKRDGAFVVNPCHYTATRAVMVLKQQGHLPSV